MSSDRPRYSDQMARRIRCLQVGSFECIIRGGVFDENEALAVLPYLEISYARTGYCIAVARAVVDRHEAHWTDDGDTSPGTSAEHVLRARIGNRGYVYHRRDDEVVVFWTGQPEAGREQLGRLLDAASVELESRNRSRLRYAIGTWRTSLTEAHISLHEAKSMLDSGRLPDGLAHDCGTEQKTGLDEVAWTGTLCDHEPIRSVQQYVLAHFRDPHLALSTVAHHFGLTETYLSQLFKEQTGVNYSAFLEQMRVEEARRLLLGSDLSVSAVAMRVGYQINSTFYRAFRRIYGVSPSAFRSQTRGAAPATLRPDRHSVAV